MLAGSQILQPPPASHEELCARLESTLLDISDLALPARLLKDAEALLADWFAAERSRVERSAAPALYRAIETLSRLTSIRRTLIGLAKALMEPPRPLAPKPEPNKPAQAFSSAPMLPLTPDLTTSTPDAPASSSFVVPPLGGPGEGENPSVDEPREPEPSPSEKAQWAFETALRAPHLSAPAQIARPIGLPKLSLTSVLTPEPSPSEKAQWAFETALHTPHSSGAPSPTQHQPRRGPLVRSSAEIVSQVRSCPSLATLSQKLLDPKINTGEGFKTALNPPLAAPKPTHPALAPSRLALAYKKYSFHRLPPAADLSDASPASPDSTAAPPDSS